MTIPDPHEIFFDFPSSEQWLRTVEKAKKLLAHNQYEDWKFIVGMGGTPCERAELGETVLRRFFRQSFNRAQTIMTRVDKGHEKYESEQDS